MSYQPESQQQRIDKARTEISEWEKWGIERKNAIQKLFAENQVNFWKNILKKLTESTTPST
jgi:hypothetical protein